MKPEHLSKALQSTQMREQIRQVVSCENQNFQELVRVADLDPCKDFIGADLRGVDFSGSRLLGFNFKYADLSGANFEGAILEGANFQDSKLNGCVWPEDFETFFVERIVRTQAILFRAPMFDRIDIKDVWRATLLGADSPDPNNFVNAEQISKYYEMPRGWLPKMHLAIHPAEFARVFYHRISSNVSFSFYSTKLRYGRVFHKEPFMVNSRSMILSYGEWASFLKMKLFSNSDLILERIVSDLSELND